MASNNLLRVMTYNIRFDTAQDGHNQWRNRKDRVIQLIEKYKPDLFGVQEAVVQQMNDLQTGLIDYRAYGVGRVMVELVENFHQFSIVMIGLNLKIKEHFGYQKHQINLVVKVGMQFCHVYAVGFD